jgi:hypothetical protein
MVYTLSNTQYLHFVHCLVLTTKHRISKRWESVSALRRKVEQTATQFGESETAVTEQLLEETQCEHGCLPVLT